MPSQSKPTYTKAKEKTKTAAKGNEQKAHVGPSADLVSIVQWLAAGKVSSMVDYASLFALTQGLNNVTALNPYSPEAQPHGRDCFVTSQIPSKTGNFVYDKLVVILQITALDSMKCISAKLSECGRLIIVNFPSRDR